MHREAEALRDYMSWLSEEAYCAGWMIDLEFDLWTSVIRGPRPYGRLELDSTIAERLRELAARCGGWVRWSAEAKAEEFVSVVEWERIYHEWATRSRSSDES
jgi:hypothetical protein